METLHEQGAEEAAHALADGEYDIHGRPLRAEDCARPQRPEEDEQPLPNVPSAHGGEPEDSGAPSLPATDRTAESDPPSLPRPNRIVISVLDDSPRATPSIQSRKCGRCSLHQLLIMIVRTRSMIISTPYSDLQFPLFRSSVPV